MTSAHFQGTPPPPLSDVDEAGSAAVSGTTGAGAAVDGGAATVDGVGVPCAPGGMNGSPPPDGVRGCCGAAGAWGAGAAVAGGVSHPIPVAGSQACATPVADHTATPKTTTAPMA